MSVIVLFILEKAARSGCFLVIYQTISVLMMVKSGNEASLLAPP